MASVYSGKRPVFVLRQITNAHERNPGVNQNICEQVFLSSTCATLLFQYIWIKQKLFHP